MVQLTAATRAHALAEPLEVAVFAHPQGCRGFLLADPVTGQALALDVHLDMVRVVAERVWNEGWSLLYVVDSHTHADHPSGAGPLAKLLEATRIAHVKSAHVGVTRHAGAGDTLQLGDRVVTIHHCPGHTPDHLALSSDGVLFSGDTLLIGSVARTDFLGGNAGQLFDSIHSLLSRLPDDTVVYPSHDYNGKTRSTVGAERQTNPWLGITDRSEFVRELTEAPLPQPANMDPLLRLNREGLEIPREISAAEAVKRSVSGGGVSVLDVRSGDDFRADHIEGSVSIPLDQLERRVDEARAVPAPRLLLCRTGSCADRAHESLTKLEVSGLSIIGGGLEAYKREGGKTEASGEHVSLERQVRILAGSLIVLGVVLGYLTQPLFFSIAGGIGAVLVVAGIADWCGMSLLLDRMPWNRLSSDSLVAGARGTCAASFPASCSAKSPDAGTSAADASAT